jgi:hypothetical protein
VKGNFHFPNPGKYPREFSKVRKFLFAAHNPSRAEKNVPASIFKIPNRRSGLSVGAVESVDQMRDAITISNDPIYQVG